MNNLANTFNIIPVAQTAPQVLSPQQPRRNKKLEQILDQAMLEDFCQTRQNFNLILDLGKQALAESVECAQSAQDSKWYRVVSELISSLTEANKELLSIYEKISYVNKTNVESGVDKKKEEGGIIVDKAVFIGSSKELLQQLKQNSKIIDGSESN